MTHAGAIRPRTYGDRMLGRLLRATHYARALGPVRGAIALGKIRSRRDVTTISVPGIRFPIHVRTGASDVFSFEEAFIQHIHDIDIDLDLDPALIIDCGANVGYVSVLFANAYPAAQIVAVEPEPSNIALLHRNVSPYPNISILEGAVWGEEGFVRITNPQDSKDAFRVGSAPNGDVRAWTIEGIMRMKGAERIDVLKIDIEGAEFDLFHDAPDWLGRVLILLIEFHDRFRPGCSLAFYTALANHDFIEIKRGITYAFLNRGLAREVMSASGVAA